MENFIQQYADFFFYGVLISTGLILVLLMMLSAEEGEGNEDGYQSKDDIIKELEARLSSLRNDYGILVREFQKQKLNNQAIIREYNRILENNDSNNKQLLEVIK